MQAETSHGTPESAASNVSLANSDTRIRNDPCNSPEPPNSLAAFLKSCRATDGAILSEQPQEYDSNTEISSANNADEAAVQLSDNLRHSALSSKLMADSSLFYARSLTDAHNSIHRISPTAVHYTFRSPNSTYVNVAGQLRPQHKAQYSNQEQVHTPSEVADLTPRMISTLQALPDPERTRQWWENLTCTANASVDDAPFLGSPLHIRNIPLAKSPSIPSGSIIDTPSLLGRGFPACQQRRSFDRLQLSSRPLRG